MKKHKSVVVYSAEWCPWCHRLKHWLDDHRIRFEERDVDKNAEFAKEVLEKSGQTGLPVTDVDGLIIIGFDLDALKEAFGIRE